MRRELLGFGVDGGPRSNARSDEHATGKPPVTTHASSGPVSVPAKLETGGLPTFPVLVCILLTRVSLSFLLSPFSFFWSSPLSFFALLPHLPCRCSPPPLPILPKNEILFVCLCAGVLLVSGTATAENSTYGRRLRRHTICEWYVEITGLLVSSLFFSIGQQVSNFTETSTPGDPHSS